MFERIINKFSEVGAKNVFIGSIKRIRYFFLQKKYGFDKWHISPMEHRKYAQEVIRYINTQPNSVKKVIDIGCGLGDVIRYIKAEEKLGYDLDDAAIKVARTLGKHDKTKYVIGSFDDIKSGQEIDYLITLGFMHGGDEKVWIEPYRKVSEENLIKNIIVDVIPEGKDNAHTLDFTKILPSDYFLKDRIGPFLGDKYIEVYAKR